MPCSRRNGSEKNWKSWLQFEQMKALTTKPWPISKLLTPVRKQEALHFYFEYLYSKLLVAERPELTNLIWLRMMLHYV